MNRRKIIGISLAATSFLIVWLGIVMYQKVAYPASLTLITVPSDTKTTLNNKVVKANGTTRLKPGNYVLRSTRSGFADNQQTIDVTKSTHQTVNNTLGANSAEGNLWLKNNPAQQLKAEGLTSKALDTTGKQLTKDNPLVHYLPFYTSFYHIDYGKNAAGDVSIQIAAATPAGRQVALVRIRSWGYDPTDYKIVFTNLTNPFAQPGLGATR